MKPHHCLYIGLLYLVLGCGRSPDPSRMYCDQVMAIGLDELRTEELTSLPIMIERHWNFGLRVKALSDVEVDPELAWAAQHWADTSLAFSQSLRSVEQVPGDDAAMVDGLARLMMGEPPISIWDRESGRASERNRRVEEALQYHGQMEAGKADFGRIWERVSSR